MPLAPTDPGILSAKMPSAGVRILAAFLLWIFAGVQVGSSATLVATNTIPLAVEAGGKTAVLNIPANCTSVLVEQLAGTPNAKWTKFLTLPVSKSPTSYRIRLPANSASFQWRATGSFPVNAPKNRKYPTAFYKGLRTFASVLAPSYAATTGGILTSPGGILASPSLSLDLTASPVIAGPAAEESDIWKTDGTTVYFFNQLRGLQVIDLSNPADPALRASVRLPASGQELYIVKGGGDVRFAVLLTSTWDPKSYQPRTGIKVVRVEGSSASLVSETEVDGWLADSRLAGNHVYIVTQRWSWSTFGSSDATTLHDIVLDPSAGTATKTASFSVPGSSPVISSGTGWLAVAAQNTSDWQTSRITLFQLGENGATQLTAEPIAVFGRVYDKFKIHFTGETLSVISQKWVSTEGSWWNNAPVTQLQNFSVAGDLLGSLDIIKGEALHATRFADDKAYVVTFRQIDPLWVIDLKDPANPLIAGQIEVPGWSTYIEPVGDLLFSIGFDSGKVTASLFDVADPANPTLLKRLPLDTSWGYSEATYDEKALTVLPDDGLVLVPYSRYGSQAADHYIQLLDLDAAGKDLRLRGTITHNFAPRRSKVVAGSLASISQRELITADITDRDKPAILADLLLAWPVDRLVTSGDYLIEITSGGSWTGESPSAKITTISDPDSVLDEVDLGKGIVRDAVLRDDRLFVLRQTPAPLDFWPGGPVFALASKSSDPGQPALTLDIYDATALPKLVLLGSATAPLDKDGNWQVGGLLWPSPTTAVVVAQPVSWPYWGPVPQPIALASRTTKDVGVAGGSGGTLTISPNVLYPFWFPRPPTPSPASAFIFQVSKPSAPKALKPLTLTTQGDTQVSSTAAGGGVLVYGYGSKQQTSDNGSRSQCTHLLRILDVQDASNPLLRPAIDLPGRLIAITDITADGFLAWTENFSPEKTAKKPAPQTRQIQVSASDGTDVYQIASLSPGDDALLAADGRALYVARNKSITKHRLSDAGAIETAGSVKLDWSPTTLRPISGGLLGSDWSHIFRALWTDSSEGDVFDWEILRSADLQNVVPLKNGSVLLPVGDYGVDRLDP